MPKTNTKKHQSFYRRPVFWAGFIIVLLAIIAIVVIFTSRRPAETNDPNSTSLPENSTSTGNGNSDNSSDSNNDAQPPAKVIQYEGEDPNELSELTGTIIRADVDGDEFTVLVTINQFLSSGGTCTLTMTGNRGDTHTVTTSAFADISTSACETFVVSKEALLSNFYHLEVRLSGGGKSGLIEKEVSL